MENFIEYSFTYTQIKNAIKNNDKQITQYYQQNYIDYIGTITIKVPEIYKVMRWVPIKTKIGDLVCWDVRLPHCNLENATMIPRMVSYIQLYEIPDDWCENNFHNELKNNLKQGKT